MGDLDPRRGSWAEYRRLVLAALEALEGRVSTLESRGGLDATTAESVRKDLSALKTVVFGDGAPDGSLQVRLTRLEDFKREHPSLTKESDTEGGKAKMDKKMLVLLVGSISGLVGIVKVAFDIIKSILVK